MGEIFFGSSGEDSRIIPSCIVILVVLVVSIVVLVVFTKPAVTSTMVDLDG